MDNLDLEPASGVGLISHANQADGERPAVQPGSAHRAVAEVHPSTRGADLGDALTLGAMSLFALLLLAGAIWIVVEAVGSTGTDVATSASNSTSTSASGPTSVVSAASPGAVSTESTVANIGEPSATANADKPTVRADTAPVVVVGNPLTSMPQAVIGLDEASDDSAVGMLAPSLMGTRFDGEPTTLTDDGRAKVVYFVAHWCSHCQIEIPRIETLIDNGAKPNNLDIYIVSSSVRTDEENYPPSAWLEPAQSSTSIIQDDGADAAHQAFGAGWFPFAVYLDADNRVVGRTAGDLGSDAIAEAWAMTATAD